ncbi:MAG: hypothetical protein AMJ67_13980 [Betaproteobacteria bacterium SG8_41]|nr:MAG: hypothetical protein AMJ67_13980 [Betaproteobacteria bacterium SG8_41]
MDSRVSQRNSVDPRGRAADAAARSAHRATVSLVVPFVPAMQQNHWIFGAQASVYMTFFPFAPRCNDSVDLYQVSRQMSGNNQ